VANQPVADDGTLECVCYFLIKEREKDRENLKKKKKESEEEWRIGKDEKR
jgi:hypothetical protein